MWNRRRKDEKHMFHVKANRAKKEVIPGNPVPENRAKTGRKTDRNRNAKNHINNDNEKKKRKDEER